MSLREPTKEPTVCNLCGRVVAVEPAAPPPTEPATGRMYPVTVRTHYGLGQSVTVANNDAELISAIHASMAISPIAEVSVSLITFAPVSPATKDGQ